ncbi:cytochrome c family protein [Rhodoplanes elegans]|uniref:Cytochrome c family protein n=1 Tax=Rhodoplanes elegans TaxID=29408 RepID=A0A327K620_9BRAD|nr:c-type cytochrome [Rhodoplanes elegans]MBK5957798.1 cytochrome c family protein [Rhodoplanes elegans]RAI33193.1 cytochrome c family protein [Rhodoplanes elegans]
MITKAFVIAFALAATTGIAAAQDVAAGAVSFRKCTPCHNIGEGATNKVGPVLNGLEGRKSGQIPGFNYSEANKNSGLTWDKATFKSYIADPRAKIPGTKMVFAGIKNDKEQDDLWAFLIQYGPDGKKK